MIISKYDTKVCKISIQKSTHKHTIIIKAEIFLAYGVTFSFKRPKETQYIIKYVISGIKVNIIWNFC